MSTIEIRAFRRSDRDQLTALVNAHAQAVVPGVSVPVNAVLSQIERQPGEFIVDPWVRERVTLVAEQRGRVSAAVHLLRYGTGDDVGPAYRGVGEIGGCSIGSMPRSGPTRPKQGRHWSMPPSPCCTNGG